MAHHPWDDPKAGAGGPPPLPEPDASLIRAALDELAAVLADAIRAAVATEREAVAAHLEWLAGRPHYGTASADAIRAQALRDAAAAIRARGQS